MRIKLAIAVANAKGSAVDLTVRFFVCYWSKGHAALRRFHWPEWVSPSQEFQRSDDTEPAAEMLRCWSRRTGRLKLRLVNSLRKQIADLEVRLRSGNRVGDVLSAYLQ